MSLYGPTYLNKWVDYLKYVKTNEIYENFSRLLPKIKIQTTKLLKISIHYYRFSTGGFFIPHMPSLVGERFS